MSFAAFTWVCAGLSLVGVVLNIRKRRECFFIWFFTNAAWTGVDFYKGLYAQSALFFIYFCLAVWGIVAWRKGK